MKISACIIVKNEEEVIERLLNSVRLFADEIIIVDTGSVDGTKELARKFTDKIYDFKWEDDFSKARNFAFSKASCDYLAWFDADDVITKENCLKILKLKEEKFPKDTYMFKYLCNFSQSGKPTFEFYRERLFKNCEKAKFQGFIHECVTPFGQVGFTDVCVEHRKVGSKNPRRNFEIYKAHIKRGEVLSNRDLYYFSKEYYYLGYYVSAKKLLTKFVKQKDAYIPDKCDAYLTLYEIALKLKLKAPQNYLFACLESCGANAELLSKIGDHYLNNGELSKSIDYYKFALSCSKPKVGFVNSEYYYIYPLLQLTYLSYKVGKYDDAEFYHRLCEKEDPLNPSVVFNKKYFEKGGLN